MQTRIKTDRHAGRHTKGENESHKYKQTERRTHSHTQTKGKRIAPLIQK